MPNLTPWRMGKRWCAAFCVCVGVVSFDAVAKADTASVDASTLQARALYAEGAQAYKSGDYQRAVRAFREADQLKPGSPDLLRVLGLAEVRAEAYVDGARHLSAWLRGAPEDDHKKSAEELLKAAEERVARLEITCEPLAETVEVDGVRVADPSAPVYVSPGEHVVVASRGPQRATRRMTLGAGQIVSVQLSLAAVVEASAIEATAPLATATPQAPQATPPKNAEETPPPEAYARAIVLGLGAGITVGGLAVGTHGLVTHLTSSGDESNTGKTTAIIGFGAAGIAGLATTAGLLWWPEWTPHRRSATIGLSVRPVPGGVTVSGRF